MKNKSLFFVFAALFLIDLLFVVSGRAQVFDESILRFFYSIRADSLSAFFRSVTFIGNTYTVLVICVLLVILPGRMKVGLPVSLMVIIGWLSQTGLKNLVARQRPDMSYWLIELSSNEFYQSFPSGHSNVSLILWAALAVLIGRVLITKNRKQAAFLLRLVFIIIAFLIGLSRLYLGVHYPSDVLGGWLLAGVILSACLYLYDRFWPAKWRV